MQGNGTKELDDYIKALREIAHVCDNPFGKDARIAKRIATEILKAWGRKV